ncbi:gephyrin [Sporothrix brasiliensis 5110]|uniref:Gephyrin n=1 Tax=Sporothrix brasiliensis 5110 TaxID=1398154 RepID=A0A0C2IWI5_9PEZI|nr:gephyrin [Sporothrix brasiliensis 5110]KIH89357.1 gephyrin [Sporothrix brasiliensis 5110]
MASPTTLQAAILVVSTTAARDPSTDAAIPALTSVLEESGQWTVAETQIVTDEAAAIRKQIQAWTDVDESRESFISLVVTTGGTGFAVSDITPEAVSELIEKPAPGLVHGMLAASLQVTPSVAVMSRPVAGVRKRSIIVTLPGSPKGAKENLQAIVKMLPHACVLAAGMDSRALHAGGVKKLEKEAGVVAGAGASAAIRMVTATDTGTGMGMATAMVATATDAAPATPLSNDPSLGPTRRNRASPYPMLSVDEALARIDEFTPGYVEAVRPVNEALVGHVLAEDVYAAEDVPAFRASIVDGYAVVVPKPSDADADTDDHADGGSRTLSGVFPVVAVSHAAPDEGNVLRAGEIARITTGAPLPAGANAVVMVENTVLQSRTDDGAEEKDVAIRAANVRDGDNVREVGSDVRRGQLILAKGAKITAVGGEVGLLASAGVQKVAVCRRPVVGVLSTGNEVVEHTSRPPSRLRLGEVRDTNRPTLLLAAQEWGFDTVDLGIVADQPHTLEQRLRDALRQVDVVVTTGGVSMGELDLLKPTIERALGGTIHFGRVAMKPGKPTTFATVEVKEAVRDTSVASAGGGSAAGDVVHSTRRVVRPVFSLPGNPASALVTFHLFVLPALHQMAGEQPRGLPRVPVALSHDFALDKERPEYHRAVVSVGADGVLKATSTGGQRSSKVGSMRGANALLCMPAGPEPLKAGATVDALLMSNVRSEL